MKKILVIFTTMTLITSTALVSGCNKKDIISKSNKDKLANVQLQNEKDNYINLDVYFDDSKDEKNIQIAKEELLVNKEELMGELIINRLIQGPSLQGSLKPVLPKETRLISFSIKDGVAIVNLSKEAKVSMSSGKEEACIRSIVNSLAQLESISKIAILVENKNVDSLGGNFDISKPFGPEDIPSLLIKK
ncbi:MAG: GerMN domain-containing protein [Bacillota bacterium]|nr:GerMN domain-containing protein [Bacillota bacterium]